MQQPVKHQGAAAPGQPLFEQMARRLGVPDLYDYQKEAVSLALRGKDSFVVVPTGGGKSFCYIIPSLVVRGLVLVVSPLIALMRDQQKQLQDLAIPSLSFDSMMSHEEKRKAREDIVSQKLKVLFVSPERLALPGFRDLLRDLPLALVAVDEAHCVHQWGLGFRTEYLRLGYYLDDLGPAPRMALTATVTGVERLEIIKLLRMRNPELVLKATPRENLDLTVFRHQSVEVQKSQLFAQLIRSEGQGIVYASTRKSATEVFQQLRQVHVATGLYHGGLKGDERMRAQDAFGSLNTRIMVATKAFGMGINLPSIRFVHHANMPCSVESYTQEIGRAGRDGQVAFCQLHYGPKDFFIQKFMIEKSYPVELDLLKVHSILHDLFQRQQGYKECELVKKLCPQTDLDPSTVKTSLEFLYRQQALQVTELPSDLESFQSNWETYVVLASPSIPLDSLLLELRKQVAWKFAKLRAIHQLVKEASCPRRYIEQYFR